MNILGISACYHDGAVCLVRGGAIVAAAQEERFTRKKHASRFPKRAIETILGLGVLVMLSGSAAAPLIYTLF